MQDVWIHILDQIALKQTVPLQQNPKLLLHNVDNTLKKKKAPQTLINETNLDWGILHSSFFP